MWKHVDSPWIARGALPQGWSRWESAALMHRMQAWQAGGCGRARGAERGAATSCVAALVHFTSEDGLQGALSGYDMRLQFTPSAVQP